MTVFVSPWAGISGQHMSADIAESLGLAIPLGVVISDLHELSPLRDAGLRVGDVVTHVDGDEVNSPAEMKFRMSVAGVGGTSVLTRLRGAQSEGVEVALIKAPDVPAAEETTLNDRTVLPGLVVSRVNPVMITKMGFVAVADRCRRGGIPVRTAQGRVCDPVIFLKASILKKSSALGDVETALTRPGPSRADRVCCAGGRSVSLRFRL